MRYKAFLSILPLFLVACAFGQDGPQVVDVADKAALEAAKGKTVIIEGKISRAEWSKSGKVMNIEFENAPDFVGAAFDRTRAKLDESFSGDLAKAITGAKVKLTGKIDAYGGQAKEYAGRMQVIIAGANQVTIIEPPATQPVESPASQPAD